MENTFKFTYIEISQPIGKFYIGKINANRLIDLSFSDIRRMESTEGDDKFLGVQRKINKSKVNKIKKYINSFDATFPNSVVLTMNNEDIVSNNGNVLEIIDKQDVFSVIDGQHRLAGLEGEEKSYNFDIIVTIFIDLSDSEQANLFSIINSEQSKVDPSLKYNLELESDLYTPRKFVSLLTETFNSIEKSPLKDKFGLEETPFEGYIKTLGKNSTEEEKRNAILSGSGFSREIEKLTYNDDDYFEIRNLLFENKDREIREILKKNRYDNSKYIFWDFYVNNNIKGSFNLLYKYFSVFSNIFENDWGNNDSILLKTSGYGAMVRLFRILYIIGIVDDRELDESFFGEYISRLEPMKGNINSSTYPGSGESSVNKILNDFLENINISKDNIGEYIEKYKIKRG